MHKTRILTLDCISVKCLHIIDPEQANGDEPNYFDDFVMVPRDDGALVIYFNGPSELVDVLITSEDGGQYQLLVSQDGDNFATYSEDGAPKVSFHCAQMQSKMYV